MTLQEAVSYALGHDPTVAAKFAAVTDAAHAVSVQEGQTFPTVSGTLQNIMQKQYNYGGAYALIGLSPQANFSQNTASIGTTYNLNSGAQRGPRCEHRHRRLLQCYGERRHRRARPLGSRLPERPRRGRSHQGARRRERRRRRLACAGRAGKERFHARRRRSGRTERTRGARAYRRRAAQHAVCRSCGRSGAAATAREHRHPRKHRDRAAAGCALRPQSAARRARHAQRMDSRTLPVAADHGRLRQPVLANGIGRAAKRNRCGDHFAERGTGASVVAAPAVPRRAARQPGLLADRPDEHLHAAARRLRPAPYGAHQRRRADCR